MKSHPVSSDSRYTVAREFCGHAEPRFVVRFCGDWVGQRTTYPAAVTLAVGEAARRRGALTITEQPAPHVNA